MAQGLMDVMRGAKRRASDDEDDENVITQTDEDQSDDGAEGDMPDDDQTDAETTDPDEEVEGDDDDYTAADEGTEEEMAASRRGANRVLAIVGSNVGRANPDMAIEFASDPSMSVNRAIGYLAKMGTEKPAATKPPSGLNNRLRGKAKALAPDGIKAKTGADALAQANTDYRKRLSNQWKTPLNATKGDR